MNTQFRGQYISDLQLAARYNVSRSTIWRWRARGILPDPVELSPGTTRWKSGDIERFEREREGAAA